MRAGKLLDTRSHFVIPMLLNPLILNSKILQKKTEILTLLHLNPIYIFTYKKRKFLEY